MKIAFIGGGNMGEAIIASLLNKKLCRPADISVVEIIETRRDYLEKKYGITATDNLKNTVNGSDVIVLAVKPQNIDDVLIPLKGVLKPVQLFLSIAAGVRISTIVSRLNHQQVVRSMPNTPAQLGFGMTGWTATKDVTVAQKSLARTILGAMGKEIYFKDENALDMVTAVSGSGPAYFFLFTECLIDAAVGLGLPRQDAELLVKQTLLGSAQLVDVSDKSPSELRLSVTSKGGTTEQALKVFAERGLADITEAAVRAAYRRAQELGKA